MLSSGHADGEGGGGEGGCQHYDGGDVQSDDGVVVLPRVVAESAFHGSSSCSIVAPVV